MTDLRRLLGANIKIFRNTRGLSQSKLAEKVNTATNYIAAIEVGRRFPSVDVLEKIACALEIDTPELFSMKPVQYDAVKQELQEQVWLDVGQNISDFIAKKLDCLGKPKKANARKTAGKS